MQSIYTDLAQPGIKKVGLALETVLDLSNTILLPIKLLNERARLQVQKNLKIYQDKLEGVPIEDIVQVPPELGLPILDKLTYVTNKEIAESLIGLVKLYNDAAWNYERALDLIQDEDIHQQMLEMHDSHLDRMENLKEYVKQLGEKIPQDDYFVEISPELSVVNEDMIDEDIVKVLKKNENHLSKKLQEVVEKIQIPEIAHDLEEDLEDEKIYIETLQNFMS